MIVLPIIYLMDLLGGSRWESETTVEVTLREEYVGLIGIIWDYEET